MTTATPDSTESLVMQLLGAGIPVTLLIDLQAGSRVDCHQILTAGRPGRARGTS